MKNKFLKGWSVSLFFAFCIKSASAALLFPSDTIRDNVAARVSGSKPNIAFPAILTGNEAESIDYIQKFSVKRKAYLVRTFTRGKKLFPKTEAIFKKYKVPVEFKVLLALESGFNGDAVSRAGAVGYWQIMDEVALEYGLKIPAKILAKPFKKSAKGKKTAKPVDERKNFLKSTHVAARYLKDRSRNLNNDWLLIAASYNWGVGNVWNAMQRSGKKNPRFWDIKHLLPEETRAYVMNFITLNVIFHNYEAFLKDELFKNDPECEEEVVIEDQCAVASAAD